MGRLASTAAGTRAWSAAIAAALCALLAMVVPHAAEAATGSISGTVTDSASQPLADVCVSVDGIGNGDDGSDVTDAAGNYEVGGLGTDGTGNFVVLFEACGGDDYVSEYYDNKSFNNATLVPVTDGQETPDIDASLADGGRITGQVTDGGNQLPLSGACVEVTGPTSATVTSVRRATTPSATSRRVTTPSPSGAAAPATSSPSSTTTSRSPHPQRR